MLVWVALLDLPPKPVLFFFSLVILEFELMLAKQMLCH
jgi:hypothetical protein